MTCALSEMCCLTFSRHGGCIPRWGSVRVRDCLMNETFSDMYVARKCFLDLWECPFVCDTFTASPVQFRFSVNLHDSRRSCQTFIPIMGMNIINMGFKSMILTGSFSWVGRLYNISVERFPKQTLVPHVWIDCGVFLINQDLNKTHSNTSLRPINI